MSLPGLSEIGWYWDPDAPAWHGGEAVRGGRRVARIPGHAWRFIPTCCSATPNATVSILDGRVVVCAGCGLDATA